MERDRRMQYLATCAVSLATITMGVTSSWATPVIPKFDANETSFHITNVEVTTMLSLKASGFLVGSLINGFTSDWFGRRGTILASTLPFVLGTIITITAKVGWLLSLVSFFWGCGTGMISTVLPIYMVEIADKDIRGSLSVATRFMFNFGGLMMMTIGPFMSYDTINYCLLVLPLCYFLACLWIPESPYYYLKAGQLDRASKELKRLRDNVEVGKELTQMQADVKKDMEHPSSIWELFSGRQYWRAIVIAVGLKITLMLSGIGTTKQFLGRIMAESNAQMSVATALIIYAVIDFLTCIMSSILADRVGRRPLLVYSYLGTGISLALVGSYFFLQEIIKLDKATLSPFAFLTLVGIISSCVISTIGYNSIAGVIIAEVFPMNVKVVAMTSLNIFAGLLGFALPKLYQAIKNAAGLCGVFWVFASFAFGGAVFSYFVVPETRGLSLREVQDTMKSDCKEQNDVNDRLDEGDELKTLKSNA